MSHTAAAALLAASLPVSVAGAPIEQEVAAQAAAMDFGPFQKRITSLRAERLVRTGGVRRIDTIAPFHDHVRAGTLASLARPIKAGVHEAIALALEATKRSDEELMKAWQLMKFYSWRDKNDELVVHKAWAMHANLEVPFPEIYQDPAVKTAILKWMYQPVAEENYKWLFDGRQRAVAGLHLKASWVQEWEVKAQNMIEQDLLLKGSLKPAEVVTAMRENWETLRSKYAKL